VKKIDQLEAFIATVNLKSFSQAGKHLGLTTSAISQKITSLEDRYQLTLINRSGKNTSLTPQGKKFYDQAKRMLDMVEESETFIKQLHDQPQGQLRVASPLGHYFPNCFMEFVKKYPTIKLCLDTSERIPDFSYENIDIIFGITKEAAKFYSENTVQRKISRSRYVFCTSPDYLKKFGVPKVPNDLKSHHYIVHGARPNNNIVDFSNEEDVVISPYLELNFSGDMIRYALAGMGIVRLYDFMLEEHLKNGDLVEILEDYETPELVLSLFYPYSKNLNPSLRKFIDFMLEKRKSDLRRKAEVDMISE
jgi:DNA-binding transcriptional LysR family regulator